MHSKNVGLFTNPKHDLWVGDFPEPEQAKEGEVELEMIATGVCFSDIHFWKEGHIGPMVVASDHILGHESAAVVTGVHPSVKKFKVGDRVALEPGIPCGGHGLDYEPCEPCLTGRYNGCPSVNFHSTPGDSHGFLRRRFTYPAAWCYNINGLSFEEGALLEPLSVALAGCQRADMKLGDPVVICGAGPIGIAVLLCAQAAGACPIAITDMLPSRLEFARKLCPTVQTVLVERSNSAVEVAEKVVKELGIKPRIAMECTGVESSLQAAVFSVSFGGIVFCIGVGKDYQNIPFMRLSTQEIDLRFQYRYSNTWPRAIRLLRSGAINVKPMVTGRWVLEDAVGAFEATRKGEGIKCMIFSREEDAKK